MNKKKIFSFGLFKEGIKQLRLIGILAFVILALEAVLIPIGQVVETLRNNTTIIARSVDALNAHPILIISFFIFAPIMALTLFSFLNKRNTSDFYHALPHTRISMFTSFFCSIVVWLVIIIFGTTLISMLTHLIFAKFFTLEYISLLMFAISSFAASLLVVAAVSVAMTVTGTGFSNVVITALILFLPRFAITIISGAITDMLPMVTSGHLFPLLADEYNIVTGSVFGMFMSVFGMGYGFEMADILVSGKGLVYTFILAALYITLAYVLFNKRKSEAASHSAPNKFLQSFYRITVTMAFCTLICVVIFSEMNYSHRSTFSYVVLYIIAALIYFIYELITTKRWGNLVKALPGLGIVVLLNFMLYGGMYGIYRTQLNYAPEAEKILSVSIVGNSSGYRYYTLSFPQYITLKQSIEIKDEETIKIVADSLADCVDTYKTNPRNYHMKYSQGTKYPEYEKGEPQNAYMYYTFKIKTASGAKYRSIYIPEKKVPVLVKALEENTEYKDMWMTLPEEVSNTVQIYSELFNNNNNIHGKAASDVYESLREEIKTFDFAEWYTFANNPYLPDGGSMIHINLSVKIEHKTYHVGIPVDLSLLPKTNELYHKKVYEEGKEDRENLLDILSGYKDNSKEKSKMSIEIFLYNKAEERYDSYILDMGALESKNTKKAIDFLLPRIKDEPIGIKGSYIRVSAQEEFDIEEDMKYYGKYYSAVIAIEDTKESELPEFIRDAQKVVYEMYDEYVTTEAVH